MSVAAKKLVWDDIKDLPESAGRTEIVEGDLVMSPTPSDQHQEIATALGAEIYLFVKESNLGKFYASPVHVILAEHIHYEPDLCFLSRERLHLLHSPVIQGPPDLIIEIISEGNRTHDTVVKFRHYARCGVPEYWLVDPRDQRITVFYLERGNYAPLGSFGSGEIVGTRILEGLRLDPDQIFPRVGN